MMTATVYMMDVSRQPAQKQYHPVFTNGDVALNELSVVLAHDYAVQAKLLKRLETLKSELTDNWNGEDGLPIEDKAYENAKKAIKSTPSTMLKRWRLFPNPNGTLLFSPKGTDIAGISIGNDEFSYAAYVSDYRQLSGREPFSAYAFRSALNQIHRILGYV